MSMNFEELLQKAYENIENDDLTAAMEIAKQILNEDSEHIYGLEIMGYLLLELNLEEEAAFCFSKSIENGNINHTPYLYLGQLSNGLEAVTHFLKASEMMDVYLKNKDDKLRMFKPTVLDLSNCFVSLSEIYMTDLCDQDDAEVKCRDYITKSIEADATNPASWQALASLNLIKNDKENCKVNIQKSLNLWLPAAIKIISDLPIDDDEMNNEIVETCNLSTELRTKCAEILFELEMFEDMKMVLESILVEDEDHLQAHYLMATMLEAMMNLPNGDKKEMKELIVTHADMAVSLADASEEKQVVSEMMELIDKFSCDKDISEHDSTSDDDSSDDEEMN